MAGITTTATLPAPVQQTFSYKLLSVPVPSMIHKICATKKEMASHGGTTLRMRRYNPLQTAMVPLGVSGVTPPPQQLSAVDKTNRNYVHVKSLVIDLKSEVAISSPVTRAKQAKAVQAERLNPESRKACDSPTSDR